MHHKFISEEHLPPQWLGYFEEQLKTNGTGYLVGDSVTIADLRLLPVVQWISGGALDGVDASIFNSFPEIQALVKRVGELPAIKAWYEKEAARKAAKAQ